MENWIVIRFLSLLTGPFLFYTTLDNSIIFLKHLSRFLSAGEASSPPLRAPIEIHRICRLILSEKCTFCDLYRSPLPPRSRQPPPKDFFKQVT